MNMIKHYTLAQSGPYVVEDNAHAGTLLPLSLLPLFRYRVPMPKASRLLGVKDFFHGDLGNIAEAADIVVEPVLIALVNTEAPEVLRKIEAYLGGTALDVAGKNYIGTGTLRTHLVHIFECP